MALINCPKCGHVMSDKATECPNCGAPATPRVQPNTPIQNGSNGNNNLNGYYNQRQDNGNDNGNSFWIYIIIFAVFAVIMVVLAITATHHKNTDQGASADSAAIDSAAMAAPADSSVVDSAAMAAPAEPAEMSESQSDQNSHDYVDLGLSVKWALCNIGASSPEDIGNYIGWANPGGDKTSQDDDDYPNSDPPEDICGTEYDMAQYAWGGNWRLPSKSEVDELLDNCTHEWTTQNGVKGMLFTASNGNSIFLPAAGGRWGNTIHLQNNCGYYWSGTMNTSNGRAYSIYFSHNGKVKNFCGHRFEGLSIRAVCN
jgi:hypothetical protein